MHLADRRAGALRASAIVGGGDLALDELLRVVDQHAGRLALRVALDAAAVGIRRRRASRRRHACAAAFAEPAWPSTRVEVHRVIGHRAR